MISKLFSGVCCTLSPVNCVQQQIAMDRSLRLSKSTSPSEIKIFVGGKRFNLIKERLTERSQKISVLLVDNKEEEISSFLENIPTEPETFEIVARFCNGFQVQISSDNVIPLICLSFFLGMTENHSTNNLCKQAIDFFQQRTLPSWNETLRSLQVLSENSLHQAHELGIIDACLDSIVEKVMMDPRLLGKPMRSDDDDDDEEDGDRPNARRKLFVPDWKSEDLTLLPLMLYVPLIEKMKQQNVPLDYIVSSLCRFVKRWIFCKEDMSVLERSSMRESMEALEKCLPSEELRFIPCDLLFQMLRYSVAIEASSECRDGLERRIGKQLDQATLKDFLIPFQGYGKYDFECVKRILKHFYGGSTAPNASALIRVSNLIEDFFAEVADDKDLDIHAFIALSDVCCCCLLNHASSDGIYKAIDIYLEKHSYLIDTEREDICKFLDCQKMSPEAREHAVRNERLPLRVVVQVLFMEQMSLKDAVVKELQEDGEDSETICGEEGLRAELERMSNKVVELERQCSTIRNEMKCTNCSRKKPKGGVWKEIKRKFGFSESGHDCNCQGKKKKKRKT